MLCEHLMIDLCEMIGDNCNCNCCWNENGEYCDVYASSVIDNVRV